MEHTDRSSPALDGIRVIDLTTVVFGPYATQTLGDYGADVIKVEAPGGDGTRYNGVGPEPGMGAIFLGSNRNKRSIVLDLKTAAGRQALLALCETADVFVHNMRPQKLEKLGLSVTALHERNPRLVYAALLGFGSDGPYAGAPAYDDIIQALSGAADLMSRQSGQPVFMPTLIADKVAAQMAVHGILAALLRRERSGRGQEVEVPMFEAIASFLLVEHYYGRFWQGNGEEAGPLGYPRLFAAWRRPYRTTDGYVCVMPYTERNWQNFLAEVGRLELLMDPRFSNATSRMHHIASLLQTVGEIVATQSTNHWLDLCRRHEIPCSPVNRLEDLEADPHLRAVDFFQTSHVDLGRFRFPRFPVQLGGDRAALQLPPRLGEHTAEILNSLDLPDSVRRQILGTHTGENHVPDQI